MKRRSTRYRRCRRGRRRPGVRCRQARAKAAAAIDTPDPDATLARGLALIEAIARRASYLALLAEHREALGRVARMIGAAGWAADFITRHPLLLDELLDDRLLYAEPDWPAFRRELAALVAVADGDTERQMNALREAHQSQVFRLLAQDLAGLLSVEKLADHLSLLADILLEQTAELLRQKYTGIKFKNFRGSVGFGGMKNLTAEERFQ